MRLIIIALAMLVAGCDVSYRQIETARQLCAPHRGVLTVVPEYDSITKVRCRDGTFLSGVTIKEPDPPVALAGTGTLLGTATATSLFDPITQVCLVVDTNGNTSGEVRIGSLLTLTCSKK